MAKTPILMENTATEVFMPYVKRVCDRMRNLRPVYADEVTAELLEDNGLPKVFLEKAAAAKGPTPKKKKGKADVVDKTVEEVEEEAAERFPEGAPDLFEMNLDALRSYAQEIDIPYPPSANTITMRKAIQEHFSSLNQAQAED